MPTLSQNAFCDAFLLVQEGVWVGDSRLDNQAQEDTLRA